MKHSKAKLHQVLETISRIAIINNKDETNKGLNDIYRIAHAYSATCVSHYDWMKYEEEITKELENY